MTVGGGAAAVYDASFAATGAAPIDEPVLHVLSPPSLKSWFPWFADLKPGDRFIELDEGNADAAQRFLADSTTFWPAGTIVIYSGHQSLSRDERLAEALRGSRRGRVIHQSPRAIEAGIDKLLMKEVFATNDIPTEPWLLPGMVVPSDARYLIKARNGTQGEGVRFAIAGEMVPSEGYAERFVDGVEYSVVSYTIDGVTGTLPPVWKGAIRGDLQPPFRRLRTCPCPALPPRTDRIFRALARRLATLLDCEGFVELELVLKYDGSISVLEINPRVSGTMRLAAMACGVAIFTDRTRMTADLHANGVALEYPYSGPHFSRPDERIFATSRLTIAADRFDQIVDKLTAAPDLQGLTYLPAIVALADARGGIA